MRILRASLRGVTATTFLLLTPEADAQTSATWLGGSGLWTDPTKWSTNPLYPCNGNGGQDYTVSISGGTPTLDVSCDVDHVQMSTSVPGSPPLLTINGAGTTLRAGTWTYNGGSGITGTGNLEVEGTLTASAGMSNGGTGTTRILGDAWFANGVGATSGRTVLLAGETTYWTGGGFGVSGGNAVLHNQSALHVTGNGRRLGDNFNFSATESFIHDGTLTIDLSDPTQILEVIVNVIAMNGPVHIETGVLELIHNGTVTHSSYDGDGSLRLRGGTHTLPAGASIALGGSLWLSPFHVPLVMTVEPDASVAVGGELITNVNTTLSLSDADTTVTAGTFRMQDGLLTGAGTLETPGLLTWNAGTMSGSGTTRAHGGLAMTVNAIGTSTKTLAGSRTLEIAGGNATWTAGNIDFGAGGATLRNQASFTVTGPTRLLSASGGPGQIVNEGTFTLNLDNPFAQITVMPNTGFEHSGTLDLQRGVLELRGTFQQTAGVTRVSSLGLLRNLVEILEFEGGVLAGNGLIHANVESAAVMEPGFPDATGTLSSQGRITLLPGSELRTEIAGLQQGVSSDFVTTTETIALGGDLRVSFLSGFENTIAPGDTLSVMESHPSQPLTGVFANVASGERVITTPDLGSFVVRYGAGSPSGPHRVVLSEYRAFAPETTLPVHGSAQGGEITFTLAGVPVVVTTTPGMTAEQVAAAIADAINQNDDLARLGIAAVAAGTLVTISGAVDSLVVSDSGIVIGDLPEVPALSLPLQVLLASLLVAMGARRSRRLAHA